MSQELKNCPFCGGKPTLKNNSYELEYPPRLKFFCCECDKGRMYGTCQRSKDEAIKAWNTRPTCETCKFYDKTWGDPTCDKMNDCVQVDSGGYLFVVPKHFSCSEYRRRE